QLNFTHVHFRLRFRSLLPEDTPTPHKPPFSHGCYKFRKGTEKVIETQKWLGNEEKKDLLFTPDRVDLAITPDGADSIFGISDSSHLQGMDDEKSGKDEDVIREILRIQSKKYKTQYCRWKMNLQMKMSL
ncbi:hypothetical protein F2P56_019764, partial [Juglans regia]